MQLAEELAIREKEKPLQAEAEKAKEELTAFVAKSDELSAAKQRAQEGLNKSMEKKTKCVTNDHFMPAVVAVL